MAVKFERLRLVLLCTVLAAPDVLADNCRLSVSQPRIDYGAIRTEARVERAALVLATRRLRVNVFALSLQQWHCGLLVSQQMGRGLCWVAKGDFA